MTLESRLAEALVATYPMRAAMTLERLGIEVARDFFSDTAAADAARVIPLLSPQFAVAVIDPMPIQRVVALFGEMPLDAAARLARGLPDRNHELLTLLSATTRRQLGSLLRYAADTAGALMDPRVLALSGDLTVAEALERVREMSSLARYNVYVVDRHQLLVGVLNLRELLSAAPERRLVDVMVPDPLRVLAETGRAGIVDHPGWRKAHALPVVDEDGHYLGTIRYRTLRGLEDSLSPSNEGSTTSALGELLAVGVEGFVQALNPRTPSPPRTRAT